MESIEFYLIEYGSHISNYNLEPFFRIYLNKLQAYFTCIPDK